MRIAIVTPAAAGSRSGNRRTALRWKGILDELGHRVRITERWEGETCDVLVALHARKSHASIQHFHRAHAGHPLIVALTGTDLYGDLPGSPEARQSLELASRLVVLQPLGLERLPARARAKARVIHQSVAVPWARRPAKAARHFQVCVLGHLRPVKDPLRVARAARLVPRSSRLRVLQVGGALVASLASQARVEAERNPRYLWLGELARWRALRVLARSHLLAVPSRMEGGANVVGEALVVRTPIVASRVDGNVGLVGRDYPGLFEPGDTRGLARLLSRAEQDPRFYGLLSERCRRLGPLFEPRREKAAWRALLRGL